MGKRSYLGLRQNSFMALTAVMKLFCVYLAPYSLFFRTARTVQTTQENYEKSGSFSLSSGAIVAQLLYHNP